MMGEIMEWNDNYEVGVESIDRAHQEMFSVIGRVKKMVRQGGNIKWAAMESIKFFKNYAIKHFEDEEKYMLAVGYSHYERHKAIHDGMRDKILPRIYSELEYSNYSEAAIARFLAICEKWLDKHIIGHDRDLVKWSDHAVNF